MTIFYFTATGNSLAAAKKISDGKAKLGSVAQVIDTPPAEYRDDAIGFISPRVDVQPAAQCGVRPAH